MLITVDSRVGSKHLEKPLSKALGNVHRVTKGKLEFADIAWDCDGPEDSTLRIGVELKTISDLLQSLTAPSRLVEHQIPGLLGHYNVVYLLIEGIWRPRADGLIEVDTGWTSRSGWHRENWRTWGWRYEHVMGILTTLESKLGIRMWPPRTRIETMAWLQSKIKWWSKGWDEHKSGEAWCGTDLLGSGVIVRRPSRVERFASILDHVGREKALPVARRFSTIRAMVNAELEEWVGIRPKGTTRLGRKRPGITLEMAKGIVRGFDEKHKDLW